MKDSGLPGDMRSSGFTDSRLFEERTSLIFKGPGVGGECILLKPGLDGALLVQ